METAPPRRYSAPALEKGLDVLELLASASNPLSSAEIAAAQNRSRAEIFRTLSVLAERGYIERVEAGGGYRLTARLFGLAMQQPPCAHLLEAALPVMERLAERANQSCHVAIASGDEMVVIARVESPDEVGFSVRIGHRRRLVESTSGRVILAHQTQERRDTWLSLLVPDAHRDRRGPDRSALARELARIRKRGYHRVRSSFVQGITDLSFPIFDGVASGAVAALTVPYVERLAGGRSIDPVIRLLGTAAAEISVQLEACAGTRPGRSARRATAS